MSDKKRNQSSFFEVEDSNNLKKAENKSKQKVTVPKDYIPIHLDSLGKLEAPKILHFRNYVLSDLIHLTKIIDEEKVIEPLIEVLNGMVHEDFNCKDLHPKELEIIMLTIYRSFWGREIDNIPYFIDETLEDDDKFNKDNIGYALVDINKIKTFPIIENFKEPFTFTIGENKVSFKLPKFRNTFLADAYVEAKYFDEERKFSDLKDVIQKNNQVKDEDKKTPIDPKELKKYEEYLQKKNETYFKVYKASLIHKINGKELSIEEKVKAISTIDLRFWAIYEKKHEEWSKFGVDPVIEIFDSKEKKNLSRRLQFRLLDFLPSVQSEDTFEYDVSFDDS
jgi:hypothetical protein